MRQLPRRVVCRALVGLPLLTLGASRCRRPPGVTAVAVEAGQGQGAFARLSGVQGSPAPVLAGEPTLTAQFREARIARSRFPQDCAPNTLTLGGVFPDEAADVELEASYRFAALDAQVAAAREAGVEILWQSSYDVGGSDAWVGLNLGGRPPAQLDRWSRVLERTLEHLNTGWAGGFQQSVRFVEFLNEPDGLGGFRGADAPRLVPVFLRFLETVERFNAAHPGQAVTPVGPGVPLGLREWPRLRPLLEGVVDAVRSAGRALPVFSFHTYGADVSPASNAALARELRAMLDARGLSGTELWNTEWQAGDHLKQALGLDAARVQAATGAEQRAFASGMAAYAIACKLRWQGVVTGSFYYRANRRVFPPGLGPPEGAGFGRFVLPDGSLGALALQEQLLAKAADELPTRCLTRWTDDGELTAQGLRSEDGRVLGLLGSSLSLAERELELQLTGLAAEGPVQPSLVTLGAQTTALAEAPMPVAAVQGGAASLRLAVPPLSSWLLLLRPPA